MERRNFLKKLFGIGVGAALSTVPGIAKEEETFALEDMFERSEGNSSLYLLKPDSWLNRELKKALEGHVVSRKNFACYYPAFNIYIPVKDRYTKKDFEPLILFAKSKKNDYFCNDFCRKDYGLCRLIKSLREDWYTVDFFQAVKNYGDSFYTVR